MEAKLQAPMAQSKPLQTPVKGPKRLIKLSPVDICCISAIGFLRNVKQLDTTIFHTSLYEIN